MQPRLLRVHASVEAFEPLLAAAGAHGVRVGWLDLESRAEAPAGLAEAAACGALRAVSIRERQVIAVKKLSGEPVLRDVVREHFTGCRLLLVRGEVDAPELEPVNGDWRLLGAPGGGERTLTTEQLVLELRRPGFP